MSGFTQQRYDFAAVSFVRNKDVSAYAYFNKKCDGLLDGFDYIKIFKTSEHIIFSPQTKDDGTCFKLIRTNGYTKTHSIAFAQFGLVGKSFKLYKCKQGFAIRQYEPLNK